VSIWRDSQAKPTKWQQLRRWVRVWTRRWPLLYWLRARIIKRYHLVDCRNNEYRWGWCDVDYLMLYACFELLRRFVQSENGLAMLAYQGQACREMAAEFPSEAEAHLEEAKHRDAVYHEVLDLWDWWMVRRPAQLKAQELSKYSITADENLRAEETENLCRLMRVRSYLWT